MPDEPQLDLSELSAEDSKALYRMRYRIDLWKWLIGTVGLTLLTSIVSWHFQTREVRLEEARFAHERELQRLEFEQKYLGEFLQFALVEDLASRLRFAHYFAAVSTNPELQAKWKAYYDDIATSVPQDEEATRIGGVDALTGRQITRIWVGAEADATMSDFRAYHVDKLGWADIGFHFYVALDGSVKLARPVGRTPAFVLNHNAGAIAIGVACDGWTVPDEDPAEGYTCILTPRQRETLQTQLAKHLSDHNLDPSVIGKRSDYRPVPDRLGSQISEMQDALLGARPRRPL